MAVGGFWPVADSGFEADVIILYILLFWVFSVAHAPKFYGYVQDVILEVIEGQVGCLKALGAFWGALDVLQEEVCLVDQSTHRPVVPACRASSL